MGRPIDYAYCPSSLRWMVSIGRRIRELRNGLGLTQTQLAKQVGIDQSVVSDIENGAGFGADVLAGMAKALIVSADYILTGRESMVWPFGEDLHQRVRSLRSDELVKLEMVMRAHLGPPDDPSPSPEPVGTSEVTILSEAARRIAAKRGATTKKPNRR